jgi:apolipoprotein N-acyltransferase
LIIAAVHAGGALVLFTAHTGPKIRVAAVQPNIQIAERESKSGKAESYQRLVELTKMAAAAKPDLIVWPESAVAGNLHDDDATVATLQSLVRTIGVPIVVGAAEVQKFSSGERETTIRSRVFNSAYLLEPANGLSEPYRKRMLLPFGEYLPYEKTIPWPQWLAPKVSEMTRGENAHLFRLPNGVKVGALICWENLFAPLARDSVASGAQILVQLTNDVWFGRTAAPLQHNLASVLRAVENRVPVVIASNSGPSQVIDTHGRVVASVARLFSAEIVTAEVAAEPAAPVYTYLGDFFALLMINMLIILCFWRISVNRPDPDSKVFPDDINGGAR